MRSASMIAAQGWQWPAPAVRAPHLRQLEAGQTRRHGARNGPCLLPSARRRCGRAAQRRSRPLLRDEPDCGGCASARRCAAAQAPCRTPRPTRSAGDGPARARRGRPERGRLACGRSRDRTGRRAPPGQAGARSPGRARRHGPRPCARSSEPALRRRSWRAAPRGARRHSSPKRRPRASRGRRSEMRARKARALDGARRAVQKLGKGGAAKLAVGPQKGDLRGVPWPGLHTRVSYSLSCTRSSERP